MTEHRNTQPLRPMREDRFHPAEGAPGTQKKVKKIKKITRRLIQWRSAGQSTRAPALRSMGLYSRRCAHASVNRPPTAPAHHTIVTLGPAASDGCCLHLAQVAINYASLWNATYSRSMGLTLLSPLRTCISRSPFHCARTPRRCHSRTGRA